MGRDVSKSERVKEKKILFPRPSSRISNIVHRIKKKKFESHHLNRERSNGNGSEQKHLFLTVCIIKE
jgi:hypothetical protein